MSKGLFHHQRFYLQGRLAALCALVVLAQACTLQIRDPKAGLRTSEGPDTTPPVAATALTWQESSPHNSLSVHAEWDKSVSSDLTTQQIQFFSDGTCGITSGTAISLPSSTQESYSWSAPTSGTYSYQIISGDAASNTSTSACSAALTISTTAPDNATLLGWVQASPHNSTSITASWTKSASVNLTNQKIQFYADGTCTTASGSEIDLSSAVTQTYAWTAPGQGSFSYTITSVNALALTSTSNCSSVMVVDTTPPTLAITSPTPASYINAASVSAFPVAGTCSEDGRTVTLGGAASGTPTCTTGAWSASLDFSGAAEGAVNLTADHTDLAGNNATQAARSFVKDTIAPSVALTAPNGGQLFGGNTSQSITWTATDTNGILANSISIAYTTDGTNWTSIATGEANDGSYTWTTPVINSATIRVRVTAVDVAGNSSSDASDANFEIDSITPSLAAVTIANQSPTSIKNFYLVYGTITDTYTDYCIQEVTTVGTCSWVTGTLPTFFTVADLNESKTLSVWLRDTLGNVSARTDSNTITYNRNLNLLPASFTAALSNTTSVINSGPNAPYSVEGNDNKIYTFGGFWDTTTTTGNMYSLDNVWSYDPATEQIESLPPMSERRANFSGVKLNDGRIWVGGGLRWLTGGFSYTRRCEIFNPSTKKWSRCRDIPNDRYRSAVINVTLADGSERVALIGGKQDAATTVDTIYLYDPRNDTWSNGPTMSVARSDAAIAKLPDGRIYVGQGMNGSGLTSYGIYDPAASTWTAGANSSASNHERGPAHFVPASATGFAYDVIVVFGGGWGTSMVPRSTVDMLRLDTGVWSTRTAMSAAVGEAQIVPIGGDQFIRVAGTVGTTHHDTVERFDVSGNTWTALTSMPATRGHHVAHLVSGGSKIVTLGGTLGNWQESIPKNFLYNIAGNTWAETGHFFIQADAFATVKLQDGRALKCGGYSTLANAVLRDCFAFNPATNAWDTVGKMNTARQNFDMTLLPDGKVLAAGGRTNNATTVTNTAEIFDPTVGTWTTTASFTSARRYHKMVLLQDNDTVLLVGGDNGSSTGTYYPIAQKYSVASGTWSAAGTMSTGRGNFAIARLNNGNVFVSNGFDGSTATSSSEIYDVGTNTWSPAADSSQWFGAPAYFHTGTGANERVYIAGGFASNGGAGTDLVKYYDVTTNTWVARTSMPAGTGRWAAGSILANDGFFYVMGGVTGGVSPGTVTALVHRYNISANTWSAITSLSANATSNLIGNVFNSIYLNDGRVIVAGNGPGVRSSEIYSFVTTQTFAATGGSLVHTQSLTSGAGTFYPSTGLYVPQSSSFTSRGGSGTSGVITLTDGYSNTDTSTFSVP